MSAEQPSAGNRAGIADRRKARPWWKPEPALLIVSLLAIVGALLCWQLKGEAAVRASLEDDLDLLLDLLPRFGAAMLVAGFAQALVPRALVERWLGERSGLIGLVLATLIGAVMPGGPMIMFPMVIALANFGADFAVIIAFITAWELLALNRILVWELPFLGTDIAMLRIAISLPMPILAGLVARALHRRVSLGRA